MLIDMRSGGLEIEGTATELGLLVRQIVDAVTAGEASGCVPTGEALARVTIRRVEEGS